MKGFACLCLFLWVLQVQAQSPLPRAMGTQSLRGRIWGLPTNQALSLDEVRKSPYQQQFAPISSLAKESRYYWLRICLDAPDRPKVMQISPRFVNEITVFVRTARGWVGKKTGFNLSCSQREWKIDVYGSKISLPALALPRDTVYICMDNTVFRVGMRPNIKLIDADEGRAAEQYSLMMQAFFQGIIWILCLLNFSTFFIYRDKSYLYYSAYLFFISIYLLNYYGFLRQDFLGDIYTVYTYIYFLSTTIFSFLYVFFVREFLQSIQKSPIFDKLIRLNILVRLVEFLVVWVIFQVSQEFDTARVIHRYFATIEALCIIALMIFVYGMRNLLANYLIIGSAILQASLIFSIVNRWEGLIFDNNFFLEVGILIQVFMFSIALGHNMRRIASEKQRIQKSLIEAIKANQYATEQHNLELASKIAERTAELRNLLQTNEEKTRVLSDLNEMKSKIFSIISHDIRSPLNTISGFFNLMRQGYITHEEFQEVIPDLCNNVDNTRDLVDNLLNWSYSQLAGKHKRIEANNISGLVRDTLALLLPTARQKQVQLIFLQESFPDIYTFCDANMIQLVIRNFVSNAIKFTPSQGSVTVDISQARHLTRVRITDTGIGISAEKMERLFDMGYTTKGTQQEKGTGLGLAVCKQCVEQHQGKVYVRSEVGKGTSFWFVIPNRWEGL